MMETRSMSRLERVDSVIDRLDETDKNVHAIAGDLDSVKSTVHGRLDDVESSFTDLKTAQAELGERQKVLKAELRDELLRELTAVTESTLRPTAPSFVPSTESLGGGVTPSGGAGHGEDGAAGLGGSTLGSGAGEAATVVASEERSSTLAYGGGRTTVATGSVQKPAPFDGKMTWDAYHAHSV
jgi:hypothetical protein